MDNVQAVGGTTMTGSVSAATQDTIWEEAAPGPVSPLGSGQAHIQRAIVSAEYIIDVSSQWHAWMRIWIHNNLLHFCLTISINALHIVIYFAIAITQKFFDHVDSDQSTHTYYHTTIITVKCSLFAKVWSLQQSHLHMLKHGKL